MKLKLLIIHNKSIIGKIEEKITNINKSNFYSRIYHVTNPTNGTSRLIIKSTLDEDVGTYSVKIKGPNGEDTTSAKLVPAGKKIKFDLN